MSTPKLARALREALKEDKGTKGYNTTATVKRVEGNTLWVHIPGGVDETPIKKTVAAEPGDEVQVMVSGGGAWAVGNATEPPTGDRLAKKAMGKAVGATATAMKAKKAADAAEETAKDVEERADNGEFDGEDGAEVNKVTIQHCLSDSNSSLENPTSWQATIPTYVTGKYYWARTACTMSDGTVNYGDPYFDGSTQLSAEAESASAAAVSAAAEAQRIANAASGAVSGVTNHFWYDNSGAHIAENAGDVTTGASQTIASTGTVMMRNGKLVASWTGSSSSDAALNFYDCTRATANAADLVASFSRGGVVLYTNNAQTLSLTPSGMVLYQSDGTTKMAEYAATGANIYKAGDLVASFGSSATFYPNGSSSIRTEVSNDGIHIYDGSYHSDFYVERQGQLMVGLKITSPTANSNYNYIYLGDYIYISSPLAGTFFEGDVDIGGKCTSLWEKSIIVDYFDKDSMTVPAGSSLTGQTIGVGKTGYKALGVVGYDLSNASGSSGTRAGKCSVNRVSLSGSTVTVEIANHEQSTSGGTLPDAVVKIRVWVIYAAT